VRGASRTLNIPSGERRCSSQTPVRFNHKLIESVAYASYLSKSSRNRGRLDEDISHFQLAAEYDPGLFHYQVNAIMKIEARNVLYQNSFQSYPGPCPEESQ
jgi:hypothetical protein